MFNDTKIESCAYQWNRMHGGRCVIRRARDRRRQLHEEDADASETHRGQRLHVTENRLESRRDVAFNLYPWIRSGNLAGARQRTN